jgi:hypothetical protein
MVGAAGRRKNPAGKTISFKVGPRMWAWLEQLSTYEVYGKTPTTVAENFVLNGVRGELKQEGLLRSPPAKPRVER